MVGDTPTRADDGPTEVEEDGRGPSRYRREIPRRLVPPATSIEAYRSWRLDIHMMPDGAWAPYLAGALSGAPWHSIELSAVCDPKLRQGVEHRPWDAPAVNCSCGIYGATTPSAGRAWEFAGWPALGVTGLVELGGRVFTSGVEYRAEHARILGPLEVRIGCAADRCAVRADFVVTRGRLPRTSCSQHVVELAERAESVDLVRQFATELHERLAARYALSVMPG